MAKDSLIIPMTYLLTALGKNVVDDGNKSSQPMVSRLGRKVKVKENYVNPTAGQKLYSCNT